MTRLPAYSRPSPPSSPPSPARRPDPGGPERRQREHPGADHRVPHLRRAARPGAGRGVLVRRAGARRTRHRAPLRPGDDLRPAADPLRPLAGGGRRLHRHHVDPRRRWRAARTRRRPRAATSSFFYVRRFRSLIGGPDEYVAVTCRMTGGGARTPLSLTDVRLGFGVDAPVLQLARASSRRRFGAEIGYNGTGRLRGRWEVVAARARSCPRPTDLLTEATLPARGARHAAPLHRAGPLQRVPPAHRQPRPAGPRRVAAPDRGGRGLPDPAARRGERRQGGQLEPGERRRRLPGS